MTIATKLKTVYDGCSDIRAAIKEKDSTKGSGAIGTLADDITALNPNNVVTKIYKDSEGKYGMVQYGSTATNITIASDNIPNGASLVAVIYPNVNGTIANDVFKDFDELVYINLDEILTIGQSCFEGCTSLTNIGKPKLSAFKGFRCFYGCSSLKNLDFSRSTFKSTYDPSSDANGTFAGCSSLETVILPTTCTTIGKYSFNECSKLKTVSGTENVTTICKGAFNNCSSLESINLNSLASITGYRAFANCSTLQSIDISSGTITTTYQPTSGNNGTFVNCTSLETVKLPLTCLTIGRGTFQNCTKLSSLTGTDNVTHIWNYALKNCSSLTAANFNSVQDISTYAFQDSGFSTINLPSIVTIENAAIAANGSFYNCNALTSVDLGENCTEVGSYAFRNCSNLVTFVIRRAESVATLGSNVFEGTNANLKIYVPYSSDHSILDAYKAATNWSAYASKIYELNQDGTIPTT